MFCGVICLAIPAQIQGTGLPGAHPAILLPHHEDGIPIILARHSPLEQQLKDGIAPILLKTTIDYKQSIRFGDITMGKMWAEAMGSLRWIVRAEIIANGQLAAQSEQVGIYSNRECFMRVVCT